jgi:hypothetical protein
MDQIKPKMSGNVVFSIVSVSVMVAVGLMSAITQLGIMVFIFSKYGLTAVHEETGFVFLLFLSDTFVLSPGLAHAWIVSIIPSVAIAAIIVDTSRARDRRMTGVHTENDLMLKSVVFIAFFGLILLALFDVGSMPFLHYVGVIMFTWGGLVLNGLVLYLDYGVDRLTWHPMLKFDIALLVISTIALPCFALASVLGAPDVSACAEWVILIVMIILHVMLPIRGARVVLSAPQPYYNSRPLYELYRAVLDPCGCMWCSHPTLDT